MRPEVRPTKLTRRSASPSGKVFRMMASVSRAGMRCRRADILRKVTAALRGNRAPIENLITYHTRGTPGNDCVARAVENAVGAWTDFHAHGPTPALLAGTTLRRNSFVG